jgi:hypothetical protein
MNHRLSSSGSFNSVVPACAVLTFLAAANITNFAVGQTKSIEIEPAKTLELLGIRPNVAAEIELERSQLRGDNARRSPPAVASPPAEEPSIGMEDLISVPVDKQPYDDKQPLLSNSQSISTRTPLGDTRSMLTCSPGGFQIINNQPF